jgi:hypothetical protein
MKSDFHFLHLAGIAETLADVSFDPRQTFKAGMDFEKRNRAP